MRALAVSTSRIVRPRLSREIRRFRPATTMATAFQQLFSDCIFQKVSANYQVRISRAAEHPWTELQDTGSSAVDTKLYTSPPDKTIFVTDNSSGRNSCL